MAAIVALALVGSIFAMAENRPEREQWFMDLGFGMFIHWSLDSQLGAVISHSLVGASDDYTARYFAELPRSFNPVDFDADRWAALARIAGMKYMVFTAKHHSGFCMFDTKTIEFNIMNTPYAKDITREFIEAMRRHGIAVGLYFSPEDFHFLHEQGRLISRNGPGVQVTGNPELLAYDKAQIKELLTNYGPIDILFLDAMEPEPIRDYAWTLQPDIVVTRGAMETPEQEMPTDPMPGPWEACFTMGTQWQYKPTNEVYKSGGELIRMLIETRAKGGNLLLNFGPTPYGTIPDEQEARAREIALWMFVNQEAIHGTRPWHVIREGDLWFTSSDDSTTLYVLIGDSAEWERGARRDYLLKSVRATDATVISVLGQNDKVVEYEPGNDATSRFEQRDDGLHISIVRAQRLYNNHQWPNPTVVKLENITPAH
jgi:alpha-L-fucosidase